MASLDIDVSFTNVPLDDTSDFCIRKLFPNRETLVKEVSKLYCCHLLDGQPNNHLLHLRASFIPRWMVLSWAPI